MSVLTDSAQTDCARSGHARVRLAPRVSLPDLRPATCRCYECPRTDRPYCLRQQRSQAVALPTCAGYRPVTYLRPAWVTDHTSCAACSRSCHTCPRRPAASPQSPPTRGQTHARLEGHKLAGRGTRSVTSTLRADPVTFSASRRGRQCELIIGPLDLAPVGSGHDLTFPGSSSLAGLRTLAPSTKVRILPRELSAFLGVRNLTRRQPLLRTPSLRFAGKGSRFGER